ncbi:MAG: IS110 family transposase [Fimbriimonadaceae bacterium]|nr:IS110 family transposase [Fimbriimonadaceae bacterium]
MSNRKSRRPLKVVHPKAAGIDLGSQAHFAAVSPEKCEESVRSFGCYTCDLVSMGQWLLSHGVTSVAMEATGVYWVPVYEVLVSMGLSVQLVDARKVHNLPGRKSDVQDCQWLCELHSYGLLSRCFVPEAQVLPLRAHHRQREHLVELRSNQILMMQKALELMNLQLHKVLSDITGVTGMEIIRAILAGERDPQVLASKRQPGVKKSQEEIVKALEGTFAEHHMVALRQAVELYDHLEGMLREIDGCLKEELERWCSRYGREPVQHPSQRKPRKNEARFDLSGTLEGLTGMDLTRIDGLDALSLLSIISECGTDYSPWKTSKHWTSWLKLAPCNRVSGGKRLRGFTMPAACRVSKTFRLAAQSLHHSDCALGCQLRRIAARRGMPAAIKAIARKIATAYYNAMTKGQEYVDIGAAAYEEQQRRQRLKGMQRQARKLGYQLVPVQDTPESAAATVS